MKPHKNDTEHKASISIVLVMSNFLAIGFKFYFTYKCLN